MEWRLLLRRPGTLALACALVFAADASAAPPQYLSQSGTLNAGVAGEISVGCPAGTKAVGGGAIMSGTNLESELRSTSPLDGGDRDKTPDDGWIGGGNPGPAQETLTTHAICAEGKYVYVGAKAKIGSGLAGSAKAKCPKGKEAIAGGVRLPNPALQPSTDIVLISTRAEFGKPRFWFGRVNNGSPAKIAIKTWAICSGRENNRTLFSTDIGSHAPGTQAFFTTTSSDCAGDGPTYFVTGLGAESVGAPVGTEINSIYPITTDADGLTDDGVKAYLNNETLAAQRIDAYWVCTQFAP